MERGVQGGIALAVFPLIVVLEVGCLDVDTLMVIRYFASKQQGRYVFHGNLCKNSQIATVCNLMSAMIVLGTEAKFDRLSR